MRIEKSLHLSQGRKLALRLNIFNVDQHQHRAVDHAALRRELRTTGGVLPPRIAELGAEFSF